jgi:methyl halide transferase
MAQIIRPGGLLVCLEFPLYKDPNIAGPPWGVRGGAYWDVLVRGGNGILRSEILQEEQDEHVNLDGGDFTRELYVKPKRSYDAGKGTDMVSVWRRK